MRCWLLTSTTYGTWLPGDRRGFVSTTTDECGHRVRHNVSGTSYDVDMPALKSAALRTLKCPPILLRREHADTLLVQFQSTAAVRGWDISAVAILRNHIHVVITVGDETKPGKVLGELKGFGSRALNEQWGAPRSGTWWTAQGSNRFLPDEAAVAAAVRYVERQEFPLVVWVNPEKKWNA